MKAPKALGLSRVDAFRAPVQFRRTKRTIVNPAKRAAQQPGICVSIKPVAE